MFHGSTGIRQLIPPVQTVGGQLTWQQSPPSAAGFVRNLSIHTDGTMLCSGDTFPLYLSNVQNTAGRWTPIFTVNGVWGPSGLTPGGVSPAGLIGWSNGITSAGGLSQLGNNGNNDGNGGVWAHAMVPASSGLSSSSSIIYIFYSGQVFLSQNQGNSWVKVGTVSPSTWPADETNDTLGCQYDRKLAIDPASGAAGNVVVIGTPENGFYYTTNGLSGASATWTQPAGTPASSTAVSGTGNVGVAGIAFDPSNGVNAQGYTNNVYAAVMGSGVWRTTSGVNGSWSLIAATGGPTFVSGAVVSNGIYFCCGNTANGQSNAIFAFNGTTWTTVLSAACMSIDVNPNNANNFIYTTNDGSSSGSIYQFTSTGGAATNSLQYNNGVTAAGDCPALAKMPANAPGPAHLFFSTGQCRFDPIVSQRIFMCCGTGVWLTTSITSPTTPSNSTALTYAPRSKGIGGQVGNAIKSIPGQTGYLVAIFDRQVWRVSDINVEPSNFGGAADQSNIHAGWDVDWASDLSGTCIGIVGASQTGGDSTGTHSVFSTNFGVSWSTMASTGTTPPWRGAGLQHCAASSSTNWCVLDGGTSAGIFFTTNAGSTWGTATGNPPINTLGGGSGDRLQIICADRVTPGVFYVAANNNGLYASLTGVAGTATNGATWTKQGNLPVSLGFYYTQMQCAPGNAGHIWLADVNSSTGPGTVIHPTNGANNHLYQSTNGGQTWTTIPNLEDLWGFGFGAAAPGFTYPTIWVIGWIKVGSNPFKWGIWVSKDQGVSWTWVIDYPAGSYDYPIRVCGDGVTYNTCYVLEFNSSVYAGTNLVF